MACVRPLVHGVPLRVGGSSIAFCSVHLVEGRRRILVDSGHVGRRRTLLEALRRNGLTPADIDLVVLTHAHWDHVQNIDLFPHAPVALHASELRYLRDPHRNDWATPPWTHHLLDRHPEVVAVEEGWQPEEGVSVLHTPGHTAGSMVVVVDEGPRRVVVAGDVIHFASVALTRVNPTVFWSARQARESIDRVVAAADTIYPGHDRGFTLGEDGVRYLDPPTLELTGIDPAATEVTFRSEPPPQFVMEGAQE